MSKNIGLILDEGPIARCYLELAKRQKFKFEEIIYLGKKTIFPNKIFINFNSNFHNYKPKKFIKKKDVKKLIINLEEYFNLGSNFFYNSLENINLENYCNKLIFCKNRDVNSLEAIESVKKSDVNIFLNSGKQIYKDIFSSDKKFIHIHPALLPEIKGADGSLWNILKKKNFGVSSFYMEKKIDNGKIIDRETFNLKKFNYLSKKSNNELNDIWFSFVDPAIRSVHLKKLVLNKFEEKDFTRNSGNYYSFMETTKKSKILNEFLVYE